MSSIPKGSARPQVSLKLSYGDTELSNLGEAFRKAEFKAMVNGGYIVRVQLFDPHSDLLRDLIAEKSYLEHARSSGPVELEFQFKWDDSAEYPEQATRKMTAFVVSMEGHGGSPDVAYLELIAIDPPSWYLNSGDAPGTSFKGRVSDVIQQVVNAYAPGVSLDISRTTDSDQNRFWMMRQDPKTFIASLLDWSSAVTPNRTHWLVVPGGSDGTRLIIKEQGELQSTPRAYYRYMQDNTHDTIKNWSMLADNALSISVGKLVTAGVSAVSGQYLDRITDQAQRLVFAKDQTTPGKKIAEVAYNRSFSKPQDSQPPGSKTVGWTAIPPIPEIYSAGELGKRYEDYVDGRARGVYLNMVNLLFRAKFQVIGHGIWSDCDGLGVDTFFVRWMTGDGKLYFLNGNWLAYGFHHTITRKTWTTDVYGARFDYDAEAVRVGSSS